VFRSHDSLSDIFVRLNNRSLKMKYGLPSNSDLRHIQFRRNCFGLNDVESLLPPAPKPAAIIYFQRGTKDKLIKVNISLLCH